MIEGLQKSIPYVINSIPQTKIEDEWLKTEIIKSIITLHHLVLVSVLLSLSLMVVLKLNLL